MKSNPNLLWRITRLSILAALVAILFSGCLEKRIVWSPDGSRAAIIAEDGLHLCDAEGNLGDLLVPDVHLAAWLDDSTSLVLGRRRELKQWSTIAPLLGIERKKVETRADALLHDLQSGKMWSLLSMDLKGRDKLAKIALRDLHTAEVKAKLSNEEWKRLEKTTADSCELILARLQDDKIELGAVLYQGVGTLVDIRPSPQGIAVAFTMEMTPESNNLQLLVVALSETARVETVARNTNAYPDWLADGTALVYFESSTGGSSEDDLSLGALTRRQVIDALGHLTVGSESQELAGVLFNAFARVRCLKDGRILFNAAEIALPLSTEDYGGDQREQLFAVDLTRQSTLVRLIPRKHENELPQGLTYFEVSPNEKQVVFGGEKGEVCLLTLATGEVAGVQGADSAVYHGLPVWRQTGEVTYVKRSPEKSGGKPTRPAEIVLRLGEREVVLSRSWSDEVLASVAKNFNR